MSTTGSVHAEQLTSQELAQIARAHWRELKAQLPDSPNKNSMEAVISELTFRTENDPTNGQQFAKQYGGMSQFGGQYQRQQGGGQPGGGGGLTQRSDPRQTVGAGIGSGIEVPQVS